MKPTKNRVFCKDCGKRKILFETEKKAENFIAFNEEEIKAETGIAPQRSYYCIFCGGWHVTSMKKEIAISKTEILLEEYQKYKAKKKEKIIPEKIQVSKKIKQYNLKKIELENEIKTMDASQKEIFLSEKIDSLKMDIKKLNSINEKEKLKELRLSLEIVYILRKQNGFNKTTTNKSYEKLKEREHEEWILWIEKRGYDNE